MEATRFASHRASRGLELNICQGRAFFPTTSLGRSPSVYFNYSRWLVNRQANLGFFRVGFASSFYARFGLCGPAWAGSFAMEQESDGEGGSRLQLLQNTDDTSLDTDERDAWSQGMLSYANTGLYLYMNLQAFCGISIRCRRWGCSISWRFCNVGTFATNVQIDVMKLLADRVGLPTAYNGFGGGRAIDATGSAYGILNSNSSINRTIYAEYNLLNLIGPIARINNRAARYGTGLSFGPWVSISFPITFRMTHFGANVDGTFSEYTVGNRTPEHQLPLTGTTGELRDPGTGRAIARISWQVRTYILVGMVGSIRLLWVINYGARFSYSLDRRIPGFRYGWYGSSTTLTSTIGDDTNNAYIAGLPATEDCGCETPALEASTPTFTFAELAAADA